VGKTPTVLRGFAWWYEHDGEILGCPGKHWIPDPVLFGAVGIPNQKTISLPHFFDMFVSCVLVGCFDKRFSLDV
jgi:hypothetical protein